MDSIDLVIRAIKKVPEKKLAIIELANSIPIVNGSWDPKVLSDKATEVELAVHEAQVYGAHTIQAVAQVVALGRVEEE